MKKRFLALLCTITMVLVLTGCYAEDKDENSPEMVALREVEKITAGQGYSIESPTGEEVLIEESRVIEFIKDVSLEEGYLEEDFNSLTEDRKVISYRLKEKSILNEPINLNILVDRQKAIGAYLNYQGYTPGINPISFKEFNKE